MINEVRNPFVYSTLQATSQNGGRFLEVRTESDLRFQFNQANQLFEKGRLASFPCARKCLHRSLENSEKSDFFAAASV